MTQPVKNPVKSWIKEYHLTILTLGSIAALWWGITHSFHREIDRLDTRLDRMENRLDKIEDRLDRMEIRLTLVEARMDKLELRLDVIENSIHEVDKRLIAVETILRMQGHSVGVVAKQPEPPES